MKISEDFKYSHLVNLFAINLEAPTIHKGLDPLSATPSSDARAIQQVSITIWSPLRASQFRALPAFSTTSPRRGDIRGDISYGREPMNDAPTLLWPSLAYK